MRAFMSITAPALALLLGAGCSAFGPNLTGKWVGECSLGTPTGDVPYTVALDLTEDGGDVSGEGTVDIDDPFEDAITAELSVTGLRKFGSAALVAKGEGGGQINFEGDASDTAYKGDCSVGDDWGAFELERR